MFLFRTKGTLALCNQALPSEGGAKELYRILHSTDETVLHSQQNSRYSFFNNGLKLLVAFRSENGLPLKYEVDKEAEQQVAPH